MQNPGPAEPQAIIKITGRNINHLRYADDTTPMAESEEELRSPFMKVKEESEKAGLKLNIQKTKIMASGPITSWQIDGETIETVRYFYFLGLLMKVKEESEKAGLKFNIHKTKIRASSLMTSWHMDGETMEIVTDFIFLGSKITAHGDCSHEIKRHLFLQRKAMTNLDSVILICCQSPYIQSYGFSSSHVWM